MLNVMRENLRSLRWVLWAVAISMVWYLGASFSCDPRDPAGLAAGWAARVGDVAIGRAQFRSAARDLDQKYRGAFGDQYESLRPRLRIGTQVIQTLISDELIRQDSRRMGLSVGPDELAEAIRNDPRLQQDGTFIGQERYMESLERGYPGGVQSFEADLADALTMEKWDHLMTQAVHVSDDDLEKLHRERTEKTAADYVLVAAAEQEVDETIEDSRLRAWYDGHLEFYRRDPGRNIRLLAVDRDRLADTISVTDDEIRASYEVNRSRYQHGAQRRARHILLKVDAGASDEQRAEIKARAEGSLARVQGGEPFEPLAQTLSEDPISAAKGGDLDYFERELMVPAFADASFNTAVGQFAPVIETQFGYHVIQVTDAREAGTTPLEEVRSEIELRLRARRSQEKVTSEADRIAGLLQSGDDFASVGAAEGLEITTFFVTRNDPLVEIGVRPDFMDRVFELEIGAVSAPLDSRSGKLIVTVDEVAPAEVAPFEEAEAQVRQDVLAERRLARSLELAEQATAGDWSLERAASGLGLEVEESGDLSPGRAPRAAGGITDELDDALFGAAAAVGDQGVVAVPNGTLLYRITLREPFDPVSFGLARPELLREISENRRTAIRESILTKMQDRVPVEVNQALIAQIDGLP